MRRTSLIESFDPYHLNVLRPDDRWECKFGLRKGGFFVYGAGNLMSLDYYVANVANGRPVIGDVKFKSFLAALEAADLFDQALRLVSDVDCEADHDSLKPEFAEFCRRHESHSSSEFLKLFSAWLDIAPTASVLAAILIYIAVRYW